MTEATNEYIYVTGQNGEIYEVCPTDALLSFLQRLAEGEEAEQKTVTSRTQSEAEQEAHSVIYLSKNKH